MQKPFIYFDQGQVLFTNDWEFPNPKKDKLFYGYYRLSPASFYPARRAFIKYLQCGKLTEKDYWQAVLKRAHASDKDPEFAIQLARKFQLWIPGMEKILRSLRAQGFHMGVITTSHREIWEYKYRHFAIEDLFEQVITSYETGYIKPEKEIYEIAIKKAGIEASEIIFIDDAPENVLAAKETGMDAIYFRSADELEKEFHNRGIVV